MQSEEAVYRSLRKVMDPEIPTASIVGLGMIPRVVVSGEGVTVYLTPTFSGCPALDAIQSDIVTQLTADGISDVRVELQLTPEWSTDMIDEETREHLRGAGIAPPGTSSEGLIQIGVKTKCPFCGSGKTEERSEFGATACKALHFCNSCLQPFERFKTVRDNDVR